MRGGARKRSMHLARQRHWRRLAAVVTVARVTVARFRARSLAVVISACKFQQCPSVLAAITAPPTQSLEQQPS